MSDSSKLDPVELIRRYCKDRDETSFRQFYQTQSDRLWRFLCARGANPEAAYDLVAEAFTRFIQHVCKDTAAPVALLYRIAINLQIDQYRRAQVAAVDEAAEVDLQPAASTTGELAGEDAQSLCSLVGGLADREQNLLLMRYWIGMTYREIAEVMQQPEGTLRRQGAALLRQLADQWQQAHED